LANRSLPLTTKLPPANTMRPQLKVVPLIVDVCAGIDVASRLVPGVIVPAAMPVAMSVRSALASATAPDTFSSPAPC
jgi:hypothetical protein